MRIDRLPVAEAVVGFLLVMLLVTFVLARDLVGDPDSEAATESVTPTASGGGETTPPGEQQIIMTDNKFDKTELTAAAGTDVTIGLKNNGAAVHNVHIAGSDSNFAAAFCTATGAEPCSNPTRLTGGATGTITFNLPAGTYDYRCDYHTTEMKGALTVQ